MESPPDTRHIRRRWTGTATVTPARKTEVNEFWIRLSAALIAIMVTIGLIVMIEDLKDDEDDSIPKPPPGYHYCANEDATDIGFCRNRR